ncbi:hypothetical protein TNIN_94131 [Trichonephila inaurata madagascariensis]|uniref:Uncharacterized protein n=1 Tax=Trichonephila inaurata madagascariensis TaxID=2747483 RepID=A0A8X6MAU2_9ARAC|nr:hypothetical protein TNIN_94131 [Trichonephila inaurata madagascariensis]
MTVQVKRASLTTLDLKRKRKKLNNIFNPNSAFLSHNSNSEIGFYNEAFHFTPTPTDASSEIRTNENLSETVVASLQKKDVFKKIKVNSQ